MFSTVSDIKDQCDALVHIQLQTPDWKPQKYILFEQFCCAKPILYMAIVYFLNVLEI